MEISESKLGDPFLWCPAYEHLETAKHEHQFNPQVIDYYLLQEWYQRVKGRQGEVIPRKVHYLDAATLMAIREGTLRDLIQTLLILPADEPISKLPILFLHIVPGTGPYLVLLNYVKQEAFVFQQHPRSAGPSETNMYGSWDDWGGNDIWKMISNTLGWKIDQAQPKIIEPNWSHVRLFIQFVNSGKLNYQTHSLNQILDPGLPQYPLTSLIMVGNGPKTSMGIPSHQLCPACILHVRRSFMWCCGSFVSLTSFGTKPTLGSSILRGHHRMYLTICMLDLVDFRDLRTLHWV